MASNVLNNKWLRPVLALCALTGLMALGGCGGGSGAPIIRLRPVLPRSLHCSSCLRLRSCTRHTAATLQVSGGLAPYQAFSSNATVLPVTQNVDAAVVVLVPSEVAADTAVIVTVQDSAGPNRNVVGDGSPGAPVQHSDGGSESHRVRNQRGLFGRHRSCNGAGHGSGRRRHPDVARCDSMSSQERSASKAAIRRNRSCRR